MSPSAKTAKKLTASLCAIIALIVCLTITSFALVYATISLENNVFSTGYVAISLNGGEPVVKEGDILYEPGATVEKEFYIENLGTCDVWYKIYLENVSGGLAPAVDYTVKDGDTVLVTGSVLDSSEESTLAFEEALKVGEKKTLKIAFHFAPDSGNQYQLQTLNFDIGARAVQTANNPTRKFN